ncbi:YitT family protein [Vagococcus acidifermentans]|nr:YitT family protein [Vagococcus acidifermentans]
MHQQIINNTGKRVADILLVILGCFLVALGFNAFLLPNKIVSGGLNGLTIILNSSFGWHPSVVLYSVNGILLVMAFILLGKDVFFKSILGSLLLPLFIQLLSGIGAWTQEQLLAAVYGGIMTGLGLGIVFIGNGSTGGTALAVLFIQKITQLKSGVLLGILDGIILLSALLVFDIEQVLFALIALFLTSRMVDLVQIGGSRSKNVFIISSKYDLIRQSLIHDYDSGVTYIPVEGGLSLDEKKMIMTLIRAREFTKIKQAVLDIDPEAFVIVTDASEVMGKGHTILREKMPLTNSDLMP